MMVKNKGMGDSRSPYPDDNQPCSHPALTSSTEGCDGSIYWTPCASVACSSSSALFANHALISGWSPPYAYLYDDDVSNMTRGKGASSSTTEQFHQASLDSRCINGPSNPGMQTSSLQRTPHTKEMCNDSLCCYGVESSPFSALPHSHLSTFHDIPTIPSFSSTGKLASPESSTSGTLLESLFLAIAPHNENLSSRSISAYSLQEPLDPTAHGNIFLARHKVGDGSESGSLCAVKAWSKETLPSCDSRAISRELAILEFVSSISSPSQGSDSFIHKKRESFENDGYLFIILEYHPTTLAHPQTAIRFRIFYSDGYPSLSSSSRLCRSHPHSSRSHACYHCDHIPSIQACRILAAELSLALLFLHRHGIVHQDVKPANIMISQSGHAILGDFGAARLLPISGSHRNDAFAENIRLLGKNEGFGSIVLQPDDMVTFTPRYAAPELRERNAEGSLEYDERVDWWSLGVSLYEMVTGSVSFQATGSEPPFDLLNASNDNVQDWKKSHLEVFLSSLLVHNPDNRLSGDGVLAHPFFEPLQGLWDEVEALKRPLWPGLPPATVRPEHQEPELSLQHRDSSLFQDDSSGLSIDDPRTPDNTASVLNLYGSPASGLSLSRRKEALEAGRPAAHIFVDSNDNTHGWDPHEARSSTILQQEAFMSSHFASSCRFESRSTMQPFPSSASIVRFFAHDGPNLSLSFPGRWDMKPLGDQACFEDSFNDSGLDFSLGTSPESWGPRKSDPIRNPPRLPPLSATIGDAFHEHSDMFEVQPEQFRLRSLFHENVTDSRPSFETLDDGWSFDEKIVISLLRAMEVRQRENSGRMCQPRCRKSKAQTAAAAARSFAAASERVIKAAKKRLRGTLRRR